MSAENDNPQAVGTTQGADIANNECLQNSTIAKKIGESLPPWCEKVKIEWSLGKSTNFAKVETEGQATLSSFIAKMIRTPREGLLSAHDYFAATKAAQKQDKSGFSWYSLGHYKSKLRNSDNWTGSNFTVLDLDATYGLEKGKVEFSFSADALHERLDGLNFIALPTHSYTDTVPRWRVLVPLTETLTDRKEYADVASYLAGKFDNYIDPRSLLPEQLWFVMSAPKGEWINHVNRIVTGG